MDTFVEFLRTWGMYGIGLVAVLITAAFGILMARKLFSNIEARDPGTEKMREIAELIHTGAMAFLRRALR